MATITSCPGNSGPGCPRRRNNLLYLRPAAGKIRPMGGNGVLAWRPIEPGDAANWAVLLNAVSATDRDSEYFTEQDLLEEFGDPDQDFARGSVAIYDRSTMAGFGLLACRTAA